MSTPVLPTLPFSLTKKGFGKSPRFKTVVQKTAANMGNAAYSLTPYPVWDYEVDFNYIEGSESDGASLLAGFVGTYIQCQGQANLFLFIDPTDNTVTNMPFALGDGTTTVFQLTRSIGGVGIDVIQQINGSITVEKNGTPTSAFSLDNTGQVTFVTAPGNGVVLTWSGSFYRLCRWADDTLAGLAVVAYNRAGSEFWVADSIKFSSEFIAPGSTGVVVQGILYENVNAGTF